MKIRAAWTALAWLLLASPVLAQIGQAPKPAPAAPAAPAPLAAPKAAPAQAPATPAPAPAVPAPAPAASPAPAPLAPAPAPTPLAPAPAPAPLAPGSAPAPPTVAPAPLPPTDAALPPPEPAPAPVAAPSPAPAPVAPAPAPLPPLADVSADEGEREEQPKCAIKDLCIGPVFTLGVVNVLGVGAHARYRDNFGFGLDFQFIPTLSFGDASTSWWLLSLEGRWYPFGGAFWLGGGFGLQAFSASAATGSGPARLEVEGTLTMPGLKLGLGFMGRDGFVMGIDLGFTIPLGGSSLDFSNSGAGAGEPGSGDDVAELQSDINDAANAGVKWIPLIPQLNLLRIGYLF